MKRFSKFGLFITALSLCAGSVALSSNKSATKLDANTVNGVEFVFANDSTCSDTTYYSQSGSDLQYLNWSSLNKSNTARFTFSNPSNSSYTVLEVVDADSKNNKLYNYCYRPFFVYPRIAGETGIDPKTRYTIRVTFTVSLTKYASGGAACAHAELFMLGYHNQESNQLVPSLTNNRFNTDQDAHSNESTFYQNCTGSNDSVGCYTKNKNSTVSNTTIMKTLVFDNPSASQQVSRYQLGLFVGCNYASSYEHQASATVTYSINSVVKENLYATVGSNSYSSFDDAANAAPSGGTVNVIRDATYSVHESASDGFSKNLTINLNGNTLSARIRTNFIGIKNGYSLTINGGGGTIRNNCNDNAAYHVLSVGSGGSLTLNNVTISKSYGSSPAILVAGTLVANSTTSIISTSDYTSAYALNITGNGSSATLNGTTVSTNQNGVSAIHVAGGGTLRCNAPTISSAYNNAIEIDSGNSGANTVYLYGATTLSKGSNATAQISISSVGSNNRIYANNGGSTYLTSNVTVSVIGYFNTDTTIIYGDNNSKVSIVSAPANGKTYSRVGTNTVYKSAVYSVTFVKNGGTGTMAASSVEYNSNYRLPECGFTAPSGKVFIGWKANNAGSLLAVGSYYTVTTNVEFWAQWQDTYVVTYNAGTNGTGSYAHANQLSGTYTLLDFANLTGVSASTGYRFKDYTVDGVNKNPGDTITLSASKVITVNFEIDPVPYIENHLVTTSSLAFNYHWYDNGSFSYSNIKIRFGSFMKEDLWDGLASERTIQGYGVLISTVNRIGSNPLKNYYELAASDAEIEDFFKPKAEKAKPSLATAAQKGELVGDYCIWNLVYNISSSDLTTMYVAAAYIKTSAGIVFLNEVRTSAAKIAYDLIEGGLDEGTADGSLKNIANMYN